MCQTFEDQKGFVRTFSLQVEGGLSSQQAGQYIFRGDLLPHLPPLIYWLMKTAGAMGPRRQHSSLILLCSPGHNSVAKKKSAKIS